MLEAATGLDLDRDGTVGKAFEPPPRDEALALGSAMLEAAKDESADARRYALTPEQRIH